MATADQLIARIEKMKAARASGVLDVRGSDGSRVVYRSVDELSQAIAWDELELASITGSGKLVRRYNFRSCKGL